MLSRNEHSNIRYVFLIDNKNMIGNCVPRQLSNTYTSYNQFSEKMRSLHAGRPVALHELAGKSTTKENMSLHTFDTRYPIPLQ